jgi:hypothetical protein
LKTVVESPAAHDKDDWFFIHSSDCILSRQTHRAVVASSNSFTIDGGGWFLTFILIL